MGVREVLRAAPLPLALEYLKAPHEVMRRRASERRIKLYRDNCEQVLRSELETLVANPAVRQRMQPFLRLAGSMALFKRITDEVARPVYAQHPVRKIEAEADQEALNALATEGKLNQKMDLACRLTEADNASFVMPRYVPRLKRLVIDVAASGRVTVIEDPDDPTRELAVIVDSSVRLGGKTLPCHVFWDDAETFRFLPDGMVVPLDGEISRQHGLGRIPIVGIHKHERSGCYWDSTSGADKVDGQVAIAFLVTQLMRLHHTQGWRQLVFQGEVGEVPPEQILDPESAIVAPTGTSVTTFDLSTDPANYLKTIEQIITIVAANHGLNRERLNQKSTSLNDEAGLLERRAESIQVFERAEQDVFEVLKLVSQEHHDPKRRISATATMTIDFGEVAARVDRLTQLKIREEEERMGLRSRLDDIMEDQPEIRSIKDAEAEYLTNLQVRAWRVERERALNAPHDIDGQGPGQSAQANGAMGSAVRDGQMSRDEARQAASGRSGDPGRLKAIAGRVLKGATQ